MNDARIDILDRRGRIVASTEDRMVRADRGVPLPLVAQACPDCDLLVLITGPHSCQKTQAA